MKFQGKSALPGIGRNYDMEPKKDVPIDQMPRTDIGADGVCTCPFCFQKFVANISISEFSETREPDKGELKCTRCNHIWKSRGGKPKKCPHCGSYQWEIPAHMMRCMKCGYEWASSTPEGPRRCPKCRSYDWRTPVDPKDIVFRNDPTENTLKRWICERYENDMDILTIAAELKLPVLKVSGLIMQYYNLDEMPRF